VTTTTYDKLRIIDPAEALPGRAEWIEPPSSHHVLGTSLAPPFPEGMATAIFGMGLFEHAEQQFWEIDGVHTTAVGYSGGYTPNPTFEEVATSGTGHAQSVLVVYDPSKIPYERLLEIFWEGHDPTQGMRQGNKVGTEYRSVIFCADDAQRGAAETALDERRRAAEQADGAEPTTTIAPVQPFYYAEEKYQQYFAKHPPEEPPPTGSAPERLARAVARRVAAALPRSWEQRIYDVYWIALYLLRVARPVVSGLRNRRRDCVMAYDLKVSAMAFGEFTMFCLVARLLQCLGLKTHIVLVEDELREDFRDLGPRMLYKREQFGDLARGLSVPGRFTYRTATFQGLQELRREKEPVALYPSRDEQDGRMAAYWWSWSMVEAALRLGGGRLRKRAVLKPATMANNLGVSLPERPYVMLAVRQASLLPDNRDVGLREYLIQLESIRRHFPGHDIYVASDAEGTEVIRSWGVDLPGVHFAWEFGTTYPLHLALALGAACCVEVRGGGLSIGIAFSETPWFLAVSLANEKNPWTRVVDEGGSWHPPWGSPHSVRQPVTPDVYERIDAFLAAVSADASHPVDAAPR
jgi:peptide-methionine (S)-S-oxide reductase